MNHSRFVVGLVLFTSGLILQGCEDSAARERDNVQASIRQISHELSTAIAGADANDQVSAQRLDAALSKLTAISGGEPGQQAAKSLLAASGLRQAAALHLTRAFDVQAQHQDTLVALNAKADAVMRLLGLAEGVGAIDLQPHIDQLTAQAQDSKTRIEELQARIGELDGPISERDAQNQANQQEVDRLRLEVANLLQEARSMGAAGGLNTFTQANDLRRQADKIELDISNREIELDYGLKPEHAMVTTQSEQLNTLVGAIEATQQHLQAVSQAAQADASTTRESIDALMQEISTTLSEMDQRRQAEFMPEFEEGIAALEKAATQAESAARGLKAEEGQAARMLLARIREAQGAAHWTNARALADLTALLQRLVDSGDPAGEQFTSTLATVETARAEAVAKATEAYTAAQDSLGQVQSKSDPETLVRVQQNIEASLATLQGKAPEPAEASSEEPAAEADQSESAPASGSLTFATPDELVAHFSNPPTDAAAIEASMAVYHAESPEGRQFVDTTREMVRAMGVVDQAMRETLNSSIWNMPGMEGSTGVSLAGAAVIEQGEDRVVYESSVPGSPVKMKTVLRKINGSWFVDADELDPMVKSMLPMMSRMAASLKQGAPQLAERIRAGELKSPEEVTLAFGQSMSGAASPGAPGQ